MFYSINDKVILRNGTKAKILDVYIRESELHHGFYLIQTESGSKYTVAQYEIQGKAE